MLPCRTFNESYARDMAVCRTRLQWVLLCLLLILLFTLPLFIKGYLLSTGTFLGIVVISALGLNILSGGCGQISLGHAGFMAVGCYACAILTGTYGLSFWLALPVAGLVAALVGVIFGSASLRVKGFYLVLATLASYFIIIKSIEMMKDLTGGFMGMGVPAPQLGGIIINTPQSVYYLVITLVVILCFLAKGIMRTKTGRAFVAVRDNDDAAELLGINLLSAKLLAFGICCFYAGIAGALLGVFNRWAAPHLFPMWDNVWYLIVVVIGGMGSVTGAILGSVFMVALREFVSFIGPAIGELSPMIATKVEAALGLIINGLVLVLFLIYEPRGLYHRWETFKSSYRLGVFSY